jgi:hypothetical protein
MKEQLSALYDLQIFDIRIVQINARLATLGGAKEAKQKYGAAKARLEAAEKALQEIETDLIDSELQLKSIDEKRNTFEKRLYGGAISNPKELGAIEKEIKMLKAKQGDLDGKTLELYDKVEAARNEAQSWRKKVADLETEVKKTLSLESIEKKSLEAELADITSKRAEAASKVTDKQLTSRYETVRKRTGNTGIAKLVENKCESCRISVTGFTTRKLFEDKEVLCCESCGRILFFDPE